MEPKNDPIEKEIKSSSKHPYLGTILIFQGITLNEKFKPTFYAGLGILSVSVAELQYFRNLTYQAMLGMFPHTKQRCCQWVCKSIHHWTRVDLSILRNQKPENVTWETMSKTLEKPVENPITWSQLEISDQYLDVQIPKQTQWIVKIAKESIRSDSCATPQKNTT